MEESPAASEAASPNEIITRTLVQLDGVNYILRLPSEDYNHLGYRGREELHYRARTMLGDDSIKFFADATQPTRIYLGSPVLLTMLLPVQIQDLIGQSLPTLVPIASAGSGPVNNGIALGADHMNTMSPQSPSPFQLNAASHAQPMSPHDQWLHQFIEPAHAQNMPPQGPWGQDQSHSQIDGYHQANIAPLNAPNAFILFRSEQEKLLRRDNPKLKLPEISPMIGRKWRSMTAAEKEPYVAKYEAAKALLEADGSRQ
ncbi:high mobility group box-domain-containing protein [Xylariomycetidae sp. FL0641]|nr:high mobility group box-domain-containing protein [Xylariomycetidae sp. FL0641]